MDRINRKTGKVIKHQVISDDKWRLLKRLYHKNCKQNTIIGDVNREYYLIIKDDCWIVLNKNGTIDYDSNKQLKGVNEDPIGAFYKYFN